MRHEPWMEKDERTSEQKKQDLLRRLHFEVRELILQLGKKQELIDKLSSKP